MDISFGNGNSILKLLRGVSHSQIEFGVGIVKENREYISNKKQITYILTQNGIAIPVHFKFFRVQACFGKWSPWRPYIHFVALGCHNMFEFFEI